MQIPILIGTQLEGGKSWPIYHKYEVCAKSNKAAQEVFNISGCDGECLQLVEIIEGMECDYNQKELWVLGSVLHMN